VSDRTDIEQVRARLDIVAVISRYLTLTKSGSSFKGRCPFHKDDTPSFVVSPEKGLWHCFGCGEGGDVFGFLMKAERLSFAEALERLAEEAGVRLTRSSSGELESLHEIMDAASKHFQRSLAQSPRAARAREVLTERGFPQETWPRYALGYAMPSWDDIKRKLVPTFGLPSLVSLGLVVRTEERSYDRFRDRIMFAILDLAERTIGFGGRAFDGTPKYLNSPTTTLFDKGRHLYGMSWARDALQASRSAVLVEGYTDVLSLHVVGIENAIGSMGTALTQAQADLLGRFADEVIIAYDRDAAGGAAALRGMTVLRDSGLDVRIAVLPEGNDPDTLARSGGAQGVREALNAAVPFHRHFAASLRERYDLTTHHGKEQALEEARSFFAQLRSITLRSELIDELHDLSGLPRDELRRDLARRRPRRQDRERPPRPPDAWDEETVLIAMAARGLTAWSELRKRVPAEAFSPRYRGVVALLDDAGDSGLEALGGELAEDQAQALSRLTLGELPFDPDNRELVEKAVHDAVTKLVDLPAIEARLSALREQIRRCTTEGNREQVDALQREYSEHVAKRRSLARQPTKGDEDARAHERPGDDPTD